MNSQYADLISIAVRAADCLFYMDERPELLESFDYVYREIICIPGDKEING